MIKIYNRKSKTYEIEKVLGDKLIKMSYESPIGKGVTELIIKRKVFSKIYGIYNNSKFSRRKIPNFVKTFGINTNYLTKELHEYKCFNDFFARELTDEARPINMDENVLISPGDGRLLAFENIDINSLVQVKHLTYSLSELIGDNDIAEKYINGVCLILRLCPTDYHRFHFIDNGIPSETKAIKGSFYSVNPVALEKVPKLFCQNKREYSIFKSENFGDILHIEVGASCVGTIVQTYTPLKEAKKGEEKGYFKFGGSTTILFFEKDKVKIDDDILEQTSLGFECKVELGEKIGIKNNEN